MTWSLSVKWWHSRYLHGSRRSKSCCFLISGKRLSGFEAIRTNSPTALTNISYTFRAPTEMIWEEQSCYLLHSYDADLEIGICVDVKGICTIPVHDGVLHLCVGSLVQVLGKHPAHGGAHRGRFQHAHLVVFCEERSQHAFLSSATVKNASSVSHVRHAVQSIFPWFCN